MVTINPAECDRTTVYTGECRNFQDTEWITFDSGRRLSPNAHDGNKWLLDVGVGSIWTSDEKVRNLVRLVPAREVTRDDLPPRRDLVALMYETRPKKVVVDLILNAVMDRLNANGGLPASSDGVYGIPREDYGYVDWPATCAAEIERADRAEAERDRWRRAHAIVEQERDQAREERDEWKARAEKAATVIDGLKLALANQASRAEAAERERDEALEASALFQRDVHKWRERAEAAEKRHTWPKVTPTGHTYVEPNTYAGLCHQHSNAAQAEVECWEADECPPEPTWEMVGIAHREVERIQRERDALDERLVQVDTELSWESKAHAEWRTRAEAAEARTAVTRGDVSDVVHGVFSTWYDNEDMVDAVCALFGVEAEPADPVEQKARELWAVVKPAYDATWTGTNEKAKDQFRRIAAHVIGQEAKR